MPDKQDPLQKLDEANEKGYLGEVADKTPNQNYTVAGVTKGAETPESSPDDEPKGSKK